MSEAKVLRMNDSDDLRGYYVTELEAHMGISSLFLSLSEGGDVASIFMSPHNAALLRDFLNEFLSQPK